MILVMYAHFHLLNYLHFLQRVKLCNSSEEQMLMDKWYFFFLFWQWAEYVLFAALLLAVSIIFAVMAYFYTYTDPNEVEAQLDEEEKKQGKKDPSVYEKEGESVSRMWKVYSRSVCKLWYPINYHYSKRNQGIGNTAE